MIRKPDMQTSASLRATAGGYSHGTRYCICMSRMQMDDQDAKLLDLVLISYSVAE